VAGRLANSGPGNAPHFHDVFEGEDPADDPELIHYAIDLIHDAGRPFGRRAQTRARS
jgi:hypothetical protein